MKECWINVWKRPVCQNNSIYGIKYESVYLSYIKNAIGYDRKEIAYRIHVKMKDKVGLSREYCYQFKYLKASPWSDGRLQGWWYKRIKK